MSKIAALLNNIQRPNLEMEFESEIIQIDPEFIPEIVKTGIKEYFDPRPDLKEDSNLWLQMFIEADKKSPELAKNLMDMRNWGTRIKRGKTQFVLRPDIDQEGVMSWKDQATYEKWRNKLLKPYEKQIGEILKNLFT